MKIISGKYKGRLLLGYNLVGTRPTMDRVKESLFATIQDYVVGAIVLDLFAGSGNLGIEALSEGAVEAYFVDKSSQAVKIIKENISKFNITKAYVYFSSYVQALKQFSTRGIKFSLIFLDPPYKTDYIKDCLQLIERYNLLLDDGIVVCESSDLDKIIYSTAFVVLKEKHYGDKYIVILKKVC